MGMTLRPGFGQELAKAENFDGLIESGRANLYGNFDFDVFPQNSLSLKCITRLRRYKAAPAGFGWSLALFPLDWNV